MNILTEEFTYQIGKLDTKSGYSLPIAYIETNDETYDFRNKIQSYDARWDAKNRRWYWILGKNPEETIKNKVQPCVEFLTGVEHGPKDKVTNVINKLINKIKTSSMPNVPNGSSKEQILSNLEQFKKDLVKITSQDEFKKKMEPIIKFRNANGHQYSILNTILILVQDPEATMVKSKGNWEKVNRTVVKGAKPILLWRPVGKQEYTREEQELIKKDYLRKKKVKTIEELTPGDREKLDVLLKSTKAERFDLSPYWYDYRFTEQMSDKEDLVGNPNHDIKWYDDSGEETPEIVSKINATLAVIEEDGINLNFVDDLGGARGVSKSGTIDILKNQQKNIGMLNTIIHEYSHEILHQTYLKSKNEEMKDYFVGTKEGRGKVEQQAELCAWIVLRSFGYDMETNINYVGIWGLNQDNAASVFDSVSKVSSFISQKINNKEQELINI